MLVSGGARASNSKIGRAAFYCCFGPGSMENVNGLKAIEKAPRYFPSDKSPGGNVLIYQAK
jgi:hypothetical protein